MLARLFSKCFKLGFSSTRTKNFQVYKLDLEKAEELQIKSPTFAGTRDQIVNICWIIEKAKELKKKKKYFCFIEYAKACNYVDYNKLENSERDGNTRPPYLSLEKPVFRSRSNS